MPFLLACCALGQVCDCPVISLGRSCQIHYPHTIKDTQSSWVYEKQSSWWESYMSLPTWLWLLQLPSANSCNISLASLSLLLWTPEVDEPWFVPKDTFLLSGRNKALSRYPSSCLPTTEQGCGHAPGSAFKLPLYKFLNLSSHSFPTVPLACLQTRLCPREVISSSFLSPPSSWTLPLLDTLRMLQTNVRLFLTNGSLATFSILASTVSSHRSASSNPSWQTLTCCVCILSQGWYSHFSKAGAKSYVSRFKGHSVYHSVSNQGFHLKSLPFFTVVCPLTAVIYMPCPDMSMHDHCKHTGCPLLKAIFHPNHSCHFEFHFGKDPECLGGYSLLLSWTWISSCLQGLLLDSCWSCNTYLPPSSLA